MITAGVPQSDLPLGAFLVSTLLFAIIIAFQQNNSKGSLVPALLLHTLMNLTMETMPLMTETGDISAWWLANAALGIVCIFIFIFTRPKDFSSRFQLSPTKRKIGLEMEPKPNGSEKDK